jgi:hypothetical protein
MFLQTIGMQLEDCMVQQPIRYLPKLTLVWKPVLLLDMTVKAALLEQNKVNFPS